MASLYFYYSTMNAGKTTQLLQAAYNYEEYAKQVILLKPQVDNRRGETIIHSRIGISRTAEVFGPQENLIHKVEALIDGESSAKNKTEKTKKKINNRSISPAIPRANQTKEAELPTISAVLVDEAQFLAPEQVWQLSDVVDRLKIPVLCYGLRNDAFGEIFTGSKTLFAIADKLTEIKTICQYCEKKATMVFRVDTTGKVVKHGEVIEIGDNDKYKVCCRRHWKMFMGATSE